MANIRISDLPASTTPLVGSEVLPIVQGTSTVNVSVANLTAGRSVSATSIANGLGAAGTPAYTFTGDLNTGMWSPAADNIAFSKGGVEVMRINSSGYVGIGTSNPAAKLEVFTGANFAGSFRGTNTYVDISDIAPEPVTGRIQVSGTIFRLGTATAGGSLLFNTDINVERMRITSTGNIGVGTSSPIAKLHVEGGIKTSRTDVTAPAATDGNIFSGTYTPTLTNINRVDIAGSTAFACQYMRVGNVVTVSGKVNIAVTSTGITQLNMTLPVASNFSAEENCAGVAQVYYSGGAFSEVAGIMADITNDRAQIFYNGNVTGAAQSFFFTYTYRII